MRTATERPAGSSLSATIPLAALMASMALTGCGASGPVARGGAPEAPAGAEVPRAPAGQEAQGSVDRLLARSAIESIVANRAGDFTRRVAIMAADLTDAELERLVAAVRAGFAPGLLRQDVAGHIAAYAPEDALEEVLRWTENGAKAELDRVTESYEPPLTLEEYAESLRSSPPTDGRVRLVARWADVQGAADFYLLMGEAIDEAAHAVWAAFRPDAPAYTPPDADELGAARQMSLDAAVVTFLYRFETVPDEVLRAAIDEYAGEAGQSYVRAYTLAVAEAMRAAGRRVVAALEGDAAG